MKYKVFQAAMNMEGERDALSSVSKGNFDEFESAENAEICLRSFCGGVFIGAYIFILGSVFR